MPTTTKKKSEKKTEIVKPSSMDAIARHADASRKGAYMVLAGPLALGAEYLKQEQADPPKRGRRKKFPTELGINDSAVHIPLSKRVADAAGFSEEWCRKCKVAAERVIERLLESDDETDHAAAAILQDPPAEWSDEDYKGLGTKCDAYFDADTFNAMLLELNVMRDRAANLTGDNGNKTSVKAKRIPPSAEAQIYVSNFRRGLERDIEDPKLHRKRLRLTPLHSDDPKVTTLADVESTLKAHLKLVADEIEKKAKA